MNLLFIACIFTFIIHLTECLAYTMRVSGVRTRQIAIAMSFVTSTLLVSRLSNLVQAPMLAAMTDHAILGGQSAVAALEISLRYVIFSAFLGTALGMILSPSSIVVFSHAIRRFMSTGSMINLIGRGIHPRSWPRLIACLKLPSMRPLSWFRLGSIPKTFLILNIGVTAFYTLGVLCALMAGAYLPEFRSTAINLSGIVNGIATIMMTLFVDPSGARVTDQAVHQKRSEDDVNKVVFYLQLGKLIGTGILAQLLFIPLTHYVLAVTTWLAQVTGGL